MSTRCTLCHKLIVADEFAGQDELGRPLCTLCEEMLAERRNRLPRWLEDVVAAFILAAVCTAIAWLAWGCTPAPRYQPWNGPSPISPPGWTNGPAECRP